MLNNTQTLIHTYKHTHTDTHTYTGARTLTLIHRRRHWLTYTDTHTYINACTDIPTYKQKKIQNTLNKTHTYAHLTHTYAHGQPDTHAEMP